MTNLAAAFTSLTLLLAFALLVSSEDCAYVVYLKTGDVDSAGTDANVELSLYNARGDETHALNLYYLGIMESGHNYFERNNLDYFGFTSWCTDICKISLGHNNMGSKSGWYVDFLLVSVQNADGYCHQKTFEINQWLATDEPPNYSTYLTRDLCGNSIHQFNSTGINTERIIRQLPVSI